MGFQLCLIVYFHQHFKSETLTESRQLLQASRLQGSCDQQDGIRPDRLRFDDLILIDDEVLSQDRAEIVLAGRFRSSLLPPKNSESVSTESAEAPACI